MLLGSSVLTNEPYSPPSAMTVSLPQTLECQKRTLQSLPSRRRLPYGPANSTEYPQYNPRMLPARRKYF